MFCPTSEEEWDSAAQKKNCSKFVAQYEYHCLINAYLNETLEVCALKRLIFGNLAKTLHLVVKLNLDSQN